MISIIVPAFNRERTIYRTLESITRQTYTGWECVVVDDGSQDATCSIVQKFVDSDNRFKLYKNNRKKGAQGARNTGLVNAKGEWIVFFDSDDVMYPDFLEKVYTKVEKENCDACGSFLNLVDDNGKKIGAFERTGYGYIHKNVMAEKSYFCNDSTIMRRQNLLDIGLLDESCPSFQEWETHIRLSKIANYTMVEEHLIDYYRGGDDTISKNVKRAISGRLYIINKHNKEFQKIAPLSYLRHCMHLYEDIKEKLAKTDASEYDNSLKEVSGYFYYLSRILYTIRKLGFRSE